MHTTQEMAISAPDCYKLCHTLYPVAFIFSFGALAILEADEKAGEPISLEFVFCCSCSERALPRNLQVADEVAILTKETRELLQRLHNAMAAQAKSLRIPLNNPNTHGSPTMAAARGGRSSPNAGRSGRRSDGNDSPNMALLSPMFSKSSEDILAENAGRIARAKGPKQRL
jgi:hypothetical protein